MVLYSVPKESLQQQLNNSTEVLRAATIVSETQLVCACKSNVVSNNFFLVMVDVGGYRYFDMVREIPSNHTLVILMSSKPSSGLKDTVQ